ncbi:cucumisin-like [Senna tora]|uniref:Cucumisin-like n=1 Tax=Senna tora TaxID=362788 RepID=A0A834WSR2_9FABA|nr:cucumisin-like [Senna tora]
MFSLSSCHLLLTIASALLISHTLCHDTKTYIVYMGSDHPKGTEVTHLHHMSLLQNVLIGRKFTAETLLHSYKKSFNGFVARLTEEEAQRMAEMDGVVSVFPSQIHKMQTTRSWDFIGFPQQVERRSLESDIIIGVIDYGIWPESHSFKDQGFGPPPSKWKGSCQNITCNNKIIGAKYFHIEDDWYGEGDVASPRDTIGHGTHCASTAAGNLVSSASLFGLGSGTARGGVPSARVAVYKPCWSSGCSDANILAAFEEAISDGVDIISVSLGPSQVQHLNYFEDSSAIGAFHAMKNGILTSHAANNLGPDAFTITSNAPWLLSVAASTIDITFSTKVKLGNGMVFEGVSINTFDLKNKMYPLIYCGDAPNITGGFNSSISRTRIENSLDEALLKGKIVVCDDISATNSGPVSGATGLLFGTPSAKDSPSVVPWPIVILSLQDTSHILSYMSSTSKATATIFKSNEIKDSLAPYVASFSSRGPNPITPNVLKPDIAAPGVNILAAWSPIAPVSGVKGDKRESNFNIQKGTSMACPHVTAAAAYVKSFHPTWSPAAIKSAIMTTATPMSPSLNPEAEFAYGAGQINPVKAVNPGLVYDISELDYVRFLCGQGYDTKKLRIITEDNSRCNNTQTETVWDLNLPSFALKRNVSEFFFDVVFHRTVTNVGAAKSTYKARVIAPPSLLNIQVTPNVVSFSSLGEKKSFRLTIEGRINVKIASASLIWDDGTFQVRTPIVVYGP